MKKPRLPHPTVGLTGSLRGTIDDDLAAHLVATLTTLGYHFAIGSDSGIDSGFRRVLATSAASRTTLFCTRPDCEHAEFHEIWIGNPSLAPVTACHHRIATMVSRCRLLILFPDDPETDTWDIVSTIAFNIAIQCHIPVFIMAESPPAETLQFRILASTLCGVVDGYWTVPSYIGDLDMPA